MYIPHTAIHTHAHAQIESEEEGEGERRGELGRERQKHSKLFVTVKHAVGSMSKS